MKVAFVGRSGYGKDWLAKHHLIKNCNYHRMSFSDQVKKTACLVHPWLERDYPPIVKETPLNVITDYGEHINFTPREMWLNTGKLRDKDKYVFIRMLDKELKLLNVDNIVITDVRTEEEVEYCRNAGFVIVAMTATCEIYENNDFDNYAASATEWADHVFLNEFDGIDKFKKFYEELELIYEK